MVEVVHQGGREIIFMFKKSVRDGAMSQMAHERLEAASRSTAVWYFTVLIQCRPCSSDREPERCADGIESPFVAHSARELAILLTAVSGGSSSKVWSAISTISGRATYLVLGIERRNACFGCPNNDFTCMNDLWVCFCLETINDE